MNVDEMFVYLFIYLFGLCLHLPCLLPACLLMRCAAVMV